MISLFSRIVMACCLWISAGLASGIAQTPAPVSPDDIRGLVARALGTPEITVEISRTLTVLTLVRINSPLNTGTHPDRNAEATFITALVAKAIKGSSPFSGILSISIDFIDRSGTPLHDTMVDHIDFREDPKGDFVFHTS
jgi:hypothetical protein